MAGDLYPPATDVELARFRDSDPQVSLIIKTEPAGRVRQEMYISLESCFTYKIISANLAIFLIGQRGDDALLRCAGDINHSLDVEDVFDEVSV